jgi:site-specific DNA-methyltransferase (adenine-specific)
MLEQGALPHLQYAHANGALYCGDSIAWLSGLPSASVALVFADPPYNIDQAEWDGFESQDHYIAWSLQWLAEASRVLTPAGSLYVCGFSEILADLKRPASKHFASCRWLIWHYKNKANLGSDWGRSHESIIHFRRTANTRPHIDRVRIPYGAHTLRYPGRPQAASSNFGNGKVRDPWMPHPLGAKPKDVVDIPTTCNGMNEKTPHPTQKPEELVRRFVLASSEPGDTVLDPFSGSGTTAVVAEQLGRKWLACDLNPDYNRWAIARLETAPRRSVEQWIAHDRAIAARRESIR